MDFYPYSFDVGPDDREVRLSLTSKKGVGAEAQIRITEVRSSATRAPNFSIRREAAGSVLSWDTAIVSDVKIDLFASSSFGQISRTIRIGPAREAAPEISEENLRVGQPGKSLADGNAITVASLMEIGLTREEAVDALKAKLGLGQRVSGSETISEEPEPEGEGEAPAPEDKEGR